MFHLIYYVVTPIHFNALCVDVIVDSKVFVYTIRSKLKKKTKDEEANKAKQKIETFFA